MRTAGVDPATVDAGAVGFRLGPRINAAGRLGHPRAALELLLTDDQDDARRLAESLEDLNRERQAVEGRIVREAMAQVDAWPEEKRARHAYVVAGEDWHEGVIGIVASRLVERYHRPVVLIAGTEGDWKGSGRSIASFDLHGALGACASLLERWGGHRAAAGLSIKPENVEAFGEAFAAHAADLLTDEELRAGDADRRDRSARPTADARPLHGARAARAVRARQSRRDAARPRLRARRPRDRRRRASICASACDATAPTPAARSRSASALGSTRTEATAATTSRSGSRRTAGTEPSRRSSSCGASSPRGRALDELRDWLVAEYRKPAAARDADATAIFVELEIDDGLGRRHPLESERFRALLEVPPLARAA